MPKKNRATLKGRFKKGDIPTQSDFEDLIDSMLNQDDDSVDKLPNDPLSITAVGTEENLLYFYRTEQGARQLSWKLGQKPGGKAGLNIGDVTASRLFIENSTGNVGIGTTAPGAKLEVQGDLKVSNILLDNNRAVTFYDNGSIPNTPRQSRPVLRLDQNNDVTLWNPVEGTDNDIYLGTGQLSTSNIRVIIKGSGNVGIGATAPTANLDIQASPRLGTHPTSVRGLNVTANFGADFDGVEFRHTDGTQGIGFGYNTIYAAGSNANQDLGLKARGTGAVIVKGRLSVVALGATELGGSARSTTLLTSAGSLGQNAGDELALASIGFRSNNNSSLGIRASRVTAGSGWQSTAIGLGMDVDDTKRAGASLWLRANGNIGIGTNDPKQTLDVNGRVNVENGVIQRGGAAITSTTDLGLYSQVDGQYIRIVSKNAPIRFYADGGIGTNHELSIGTGGATITGALSFGSTRRQMINLYGTSEGIGVQDYTTYFRSSSHFAWYKGGIHSDAGLDPGANGTALMVLKDGKLGIGTATPAAKLEVNGDIIAAEGMDHPMKSLSQFQNNTTMRSGIYQNEGLGLGNASGTEVLNDWWHVINMHHQNNDGYNAQIAVPLSGTPNDIFFRTSRAAAWSQWRKVLSENSSGRVGIGIDDPNYSLEVAGDISVGRVTTTPVLGYGARLYFNGAADNSDPLWIARYNMSDNKTALRINLGDDEISDQLQVGYTWYGDGAWHSRFIFDSSGAHAPSDIRLKEEIDTIPDALQIVKRIRGVQFHWKRQHQKNSRPASKSFGVLAQELETIVPNAVCTDESGYKFVNYDSLVPLLIESLKSQQTQIEELQTATQRRKLAAGGKKS